MSHIDRRRLAPLFLRCPAASPLVLADRLLALAEDADRAGLRPAAERLVALAHEVLDQPPSAFLRAADSGCP